MIGKSRQHYTLFLFIFLSLISELAIAQRVESGPKEIRSFQFDRLSFYTIGWSKDGKYAFATLGPDKEGRLNFSWIIQDMVEDKILYTAPRTYVLDDQSLSELWDKHPEWFSQLRRFDIESTSSAQYGDKTFSINEHSYRMNAAVSRVESMENPLGKVEKIELKLFKNENSYKTIYTYGSGDNSVSDVVIKGYVKSPFESRIAIVSLELNPQSESQSGWNYVCAGAHLGIGFQNLEVKSSELVTALLNGQYYVSRLLLSEGADPNEIGPRGYNALLIASRLGNWDIVELLLDSGALPAGSDDLGRNPLHYAAIAKKRDLLSRMVKLGGSLDTPDSEGKSPRSYL